MQHQPNQKELEARVEIARIALVHAETMLVLHEKAALTTKEIVPQRLPDGKWKLWLIRPGENVRWHD